MAAFVTKVLLLMVSMSVSAAASTTTLPASTNTISTSSSTETTTELDSTTVTETATVTGQSNSSDGNNTTTSDAPTSATMINSNTTTSNPDQTSPTEITTNTAVTTNHATSKTEAPVCASQVPDNKWVATAVVVSFLCGVLIVVIPLVLLRLHRRRKWCFAERHAPVKDKWKNASVKVTDKVIRMHTLEKLRSNEVETTLEKSQIVSNGSVKSIEKYEPKPELDIDASKSPTEETTEHAKLYCNMGGSETRKDEAEFTDENTAKDLPSVEVPSETIDNATTTGQAEVDTEQNVGNDTGAENAPKVARPQSITPEDITDTLTVESELNDGKFSTRIKVTKPTEEVEKDIESSTEQSKETDGNNVFIGLNDSFRNAYKLGDIEVFEYDRDSAISEANLNDCFSFENENFRNSRVPSQCH